MKRLFKDIRELITATFAKAIRDDIITQGAAIAFYTLFSIAPMIMLILSLAGIFMPQEDAMRQLHYQMVEYLGPDIAGSLVQFLQEHSLSTSNLWTSIFATGIIVFGATTVINQLKHTLNRIWNIHRIRIHTVSSFLLNRLLSFGMILLFTALLGASLLAEGLVSIMGTFFQEQFPLVPLDVYRILSQSTTLGLAVISFLLIFKILPDVHARWSDVLVGSIVTTLLFLLGKSLIGLYLSATGIQATYRAAGTLVIFIVWVYYNVQTVLLGAVFTQVYTEKFGGRILPYKFVELKEMTGLSGKKTRSGLQEKS